VIAKKKANAAQILNATSSLTALRSKLKRRNGFQGEMRAQFFRIIKGSTFGTDGKGSTFGNDGNANPKKDPDLVRIAFEPSAQSKFAGMAVTTF
jgi:hypothetical protein